jgi:hypothetical protein
MNHRPAATHLRADFNSGIHTFKIGRWGKDARTRSQVRATWRKKKIPFISLISNIHAPLPPFIAPPKKIRLHSHADGF